MSEFLRSLLSPLRWMLGLGELDAYAQSVRLTDRGVTGDTPPSGFLVEEVAQNFQVFVDQVARQQIMLSRALSVQYEVLIPKSDFQMKMGNIHLSYAYEPSATASGDMIYASRIGKSYILFFLGDCVGKGFPSALVMGVIRGALWGYSHIVGMAADRNTPEGVFNIFSTLPGILHKSIATKEGKIGVTGLLGLVDVRSRTLKFFNIQHHPYPALFRRMDMKEIEGDEILPQLGDPDFPQGVLRGYMNTLQLQTGDMLVCATDGIVEAKPVYERAYGMTGIRNSVFSRIDQTSDRIGRGLIQDALLHHTGSASMDPKATGERQQDPPDDMAVLFLTALPPQEAS